MSARIWSLADVYVTIDGVLITEFGDGDAISIALADDDVVGIVGANGAVAYSFKHNKIAEVTLNILQTSRDNKRLNDLVNQILLDRRGSLSIEVVDGRSKEGEETVFTSSQAVPKKRPDMPFATEAGQISWVFLAAVERYQLGGSEEA